MEFKDILAISGYPGLYRFVAQAKNGIIVESFDTGKRMHAGAHLKVSSMDDIAVFTHEGEARLIEIFRKISELENGGEAPDPKSDKDTLFAYFEKVLPEFDRSRVYQSDIRKIMQWYNILLKHNLLNLEEQEEEQKKEATEKDKAQPRPSKPAGSAAKKSTPKKTTSQGQKIASAGGGQKRMPVSTKNK
ncbi:MAG: DUF5606 domain-containing protein [Bacteroidales bacterium]